MLIYLLIFTSLFVCNAVSTQNDGYCSATTDQCYDKKDSEEKKLLFYDVNPPEGFNLRRDVYMRFAIMFSEARKRSKRLNWSLILPPWHNLYHWRSQIGYEPLPWGLFFDVSSLKSYAPVKEMYEVFNGANTKILQLDRLYVLQNFPDAFENGEFKEKWEINKSTKCSYNGEFWGYHNVTAKEIVCIHFQGKASKLWELLLLHPEDKKVMFAHGEIALHDKYGTKEYWDCRKSMKFNKELVNVATKFMKGNFNCSYKCTNFASLHWRRQDFVRGRAKEVPSVTGTAKQIENTLKKSYSNIKTIFIATDTTQAELRELISELTDRNYKSVYYKPMQQELEMFRDGGVAIIEQIISSHSAYFFGSHESTFTFRIQEEREILGWPSGTTFNRLCPNTGPCENMSKWTIVH